MSEFSIYVAGLSLAEVEAKVAAWPGRAQLAVVDVEEADEYPGYTVAVDGWNSRDAWTNLGTDARTVAQELADYLGDAEPSWVLDERIIAAT